MNNRLPEKNVASVSFDLTDQEARIERLPAGRGREAEQAMLRISGVQKSKDQAGPLTLSEEELIELLHKAIHAGVISPAFIGKLRERIEI